MELDDGIAYIQKELHRILPELCEIERQILTQRFGLNGGKPSTLDDIAGQLNISISQIREVEEHLISLTRHPSRSQNLREYLTEDTFEKANFDDVVNIISRIPSRGIFTSDFNAFFEEIFSIDSDENSINGIQLTSGYIDEYFEEQYGHEFNPEALFGESLYETLCGGYFSWSSEFDFLIELTLDKWINEEPAALEVNFNEHPTWMDKVGFAIALISNILNTDPLDLAFNYMVSASQENYLTGLLPFEARAMLNHESLAKDFISRNVRVSEELLPYISEASDQYASDYGQLGRNIESRLLFYCADLISRIYWFARWGCGFDDSE